MHARHTRGHRYTRAVRAHAAGGRRPPASLLTKAEGALSKLLACNAAVAKERTAPAPCTGHAFVVFERKSDAARCVRHFEVIRRHERSRGGVSGYGVDFRQLYFRASHKLEVTRAPEPSDVIWTNLRVTRRQQRWKNVQTTLVLLLFSCISSCFIGIANVQATSYSLGAVTTLWSTPVIIVANVIIFILVPQLAVNVERHHHRSTLQLFMLLKMVFFQTFNTCITASIFLFLSWANVPPSSPSYSVCPLPQMEPLPETASCWGQLSLQHFNFNRECVRHWCVTRPPPRATATGETATRSRSAKPPRVKPPRTRHAPRETASRRRDGGGRPAQRARGRRCSPQS